MEQLRLREGCESSKVCGLGRASPTTVYRFFKDERVQTCTAAKLFVDNLGISDIRPYQLHAGEFRSGQTIPAANPVGDQSWLNDGVKLQLPIESDFAPCWRGPHSKQKRQACGFRSDLLVTVGLLCIS